MRGGIVYVAKKFWQEYGTFLRDIAKQKYGTALLSTGTALNYLGQPKETVRKNV